MKKVFLVTLVSLFCFSFVNAQTTGSFNQITIGARTGSPGTATRLTVVPLKHSNNWVLNTRDDSSDAFLDVYYSSVQQMTLKWNTGIGIGTANPRYKLDVNGTIRAKEVIVETGWADFVFDDNYDLPSLRDVEAHINKHKHLPGIPAESEVKENGVNLGEMNVKLLQKIEELTLYVIEQQKEIDALKKMVNLDHDTN